MSTTSGRTTDAGRLPQGDPRLLEDEVARALLRSAIPARLAYAAADGTPRIVPTWFEWTGDEVVMPTYVSGPEAGIRHPAARIAALRANPAVALTIDTDGHPPRALLVRGRASIEIVDGVPEEFLQASVKSESARGAEDFEAQVRELYDSMARITVEPTWARMNDFETTLPKDVERAIANRS